MNNCISTTGCIMPMPCVGDCILDILSPEVRVYVASLQQKIADLEARVVVLEAQIEGGGL